MEDEITLKRLILVKSLYTEGLEKVSSQHHYADQMLAVVHLFLAVESVMGAVVLSINEQPKSAQGSKGYAGSKPSAEQVQNFKLGDYHKFEQLFNQVVAILRESGKLKDDERLFNYGILERLQKARNDAQHGARAPHPSDLSEMVTTTESFINRILQLQFVDIATSLAEVSMAKLITDGTLCEYILNAEKELSNNNYKICALYIWIAFLLGRLKRRYDWWRPRADHRVLDDYDDSRIISAFWGVREYKDNDTKLLYHIMAQTSKLPRMFDNWMLGVDQIDREKLSELTPRLVHYDDNVPSIPPADEIVAQAILDDLISGKETWNGPYFSSIPSKIDCIWLVNFVTDTLLRWQREERGSFTEINPIYLNAIPLLLKFS